jgi:NAD(P)-dependent dehydrogenase (short-subunit alcohol dehydrogenase family)
MLAQMPLARVGTPDDLVGPCLFLLSDASAWMTGQVLNVDGGQIMRP